MTKCRDKGMHYKIARPESHKEINLFLRNKVVKSSEERLAELHSKKLYNISPVKQAMEFIKKDDAAQVTDFSSNKNEKHYG